MIIKLSMEADKESKALCLFCMKYITEKETNIILENRTMR